MVQPKTSHSMTSHKKESSEANTFTMSGWVFVEADGSSSGCHATTHGRKPGIPGKELAFHTCRDEHDVEILSIYVELFWHRYVCMNSKIIHRKGTIVLCWKKFSSCSSSLFIVTLVAVRPQATNTEAITPKATAQMHFQAALNRCIILCLHSSV